MQLIGDKQKSLHVVRLYCNLNIAIVMYPILFYCNRYIGYQDILVI
jgi:hypothetical protein